MKEILDVVVHILILQIRNNFPKNTDDKCFPDTITFVLNFEEIKWNPEKFSNIKPFINKYN